MVKREKIQFAVLSKTRQIYEASQLISYENEPLLRFHVIFKRGIPYFEVQTLGYVLTVDFQYELNRFLNQAMSLVLNHDSLMDKLI